MVDFVFTPHMERVSNLLWAVTSAVGAGLCFLVLLVIGAVWLHPVSRPHLDRVSFRIVWLALFANMVFGVFSAVGGMMTHGGFLCGFSIFMLQLTLQISSFLLFCIALNLQLVVVNGFNAQNLEKFYFGFSLVLSAVLVVPAYSANQYGWDPIEQDCWYKNDNRNQRLAWQIATQMVWTALTAIGEIMASLSVMLFMIRHRKRASRVFVSPRSVSRTENPSLILHANSYKRIILRIALYPLASCFVNFLSISTALHSTIAGGIHNQTDYNILLLSDFLYGGRAIVYALLAVSDPALVRGVTTLYRTIIYGSHSSVSADSKESSAHEGQSNGIVVHIELTTIHDSEPEEDSSPKQTEIGLRLGNETHPESNAGATPLQLPSRSSSSTQRRDEAFRRDQLLIDDFNKRI